MKKQTIYCARAIRAGDEFDLAITFDLEKARAAILDYFHHLTRSERAEQSLFIDGYTVAIMDGETAEVAYNRLLDEDELPPDPDFYEPFEPFKEAPPVLSKYAYQELRARAESGAPEDIHALGEWFQEYGTEYWNGEFYDADGLRLFPVYRESFDDDGEPLDQFEIVGWEAR